MSRIYCGECFKKQEIIDRLKEENESLKAKLRYQERKVNEGYFGSSTPSSKKPYKNKSLEENQQKKGGAKPGHKGNGRKPLTFETADEVIELEAPQVCPDCGATTEGMGGRQRSVIDLEPVLIKKIVYRLKRRRCPGCDKVLQAEVSGVLPKCLYSNRLMAHVAVEHYANGLTLGYLEQQTGVGIGSLVDAMHHLGRLLKEVPDKLIEDYRQSLLKQADETGWHIDGVSGYTWLFCTPQISIFRFRHTRSGKIAQEVLGKKALPGILVVDRYAGYNQSPCKIQYCYAHLLRNVQDLEKEFPNNNEILAFVQTVGPLLSEAMSLRSTTITDQQFYRQAKIVKNKIIQVMNQDARNPGIQYIQNIFREHEDRLYHWADNRIIPADNNRSERELRPLVIARKTSFGSQSSAGARTREILMTVLLSLKKQNPDLNLENIFAQGLNKMTINPEIDPYAILFPDTS
ncbi:IS66 family transposase [bacterium]|nr:IS66 family transposase [bacterium]